MLKRWILQHNIKLLHVLIAGERHVAERPIGYYITLNEVTTMEPLRHNVTAVTVRCRIFYVRL